MIAYLGKKRTGSSNSKITFHGSNSSSQAFFSVAGVDSPVPARGNHRLKTKDAFLGVFYKLLVRI